MPDLVTLIPPWARLALLVLLLPLSLAVAADPEEDWPAIHGLVSKWALALQNHDAETMETLLHPDFQSRADLLPGEGPDLLMLLRTRLITFESVLDKHATFDRRNGEIRVEPVVYSLAFFQQPKAFTLTLKKYQDAWRVATVEDSFNIPQGYISALPEQQRLYPVSVRIHGGDAGAPVHARVHVQDVHGEYWPPAGHMKYFPYGFNNAVGGDVIVDGKRFAYVEPEFTLPLAAGRYEMEVAKGMEYEPGTVAFEVEPGSVPRLEVGVKRWIDMNQRGWFSGDTHVHFLSPGAALLEGRAEDLNVVNILATKWGEFYSNVADFTGAPSKESDAGHIVYVNEEARHAHLGHTNLLNLKQLVHPLAWGGNSLSNPSVRGGHDYPAMATIAAAAQQQGGLVSWAHFPSPEAEIAVDFALGTIDAVDLLTWGDPLTPTEGSQSAVQAWYRLLNAGYRVPALGGTDKMFNSQITGSVRSYVKLDQPFSYASWIEGIRAGRTFATNGPMLIMTVNGNEPGATVELHRAATVQVHFVIDALIPVDTIEVILNGDVVAERTIADGSVHREFTAKVRVTKGSWIAARAYSDRMFTYQSFPPYIPPMRHFAHTSPVYLNLAGKGAQSKPALRELLAQVDKVIEWTNTEATFTEDAQRQEILELFQQARKIYERKLGLE